jgi:hypothetical protein
MAILPKTVIRWISLHLAANKNHPNLYEGKPLFTSVLVHCSRLNQLFHKHGLWAIGYYFSFTQASTYACSSKIIIQNIVK